MSASSDARRRATVLHSLADDVDRKRNAMTTFDAVAVDVLVEEADALRRKAREWDAVAANAEFEAREAIR